MAETGSNLPATLADTPPPLLGSRAATDFIEGFYNLNVIRQLGLMIAIAASVAIGVFIVLWAQGGDYRPLYGSIHNIDVTKVVQVLESNRIKYKIDEASGALLVDDAQIHNARLKLADAGFPGQKAMGFELLDQEQPLGTSQFMETARYRRSLEGELARTISSISIVRQARVHLAMPKSTVFIRDQRKPTASVLVDLFPGTNLTREQVSAIANLVASSVPELSLSDVAVVDQKGNLLSKFEDENDELAEAEKHMKYARKLEQEMAERIERILTPVVGSGKFRAEVSADIDFTEVEQTDEVFNPDLPAVRSEQTLDEQKVGAGLDGGIPGALTNQPPGVGDAPEQVAGAGADGGAGGPVNTRKQATRNYELDRTISYTKHQVGRVRRLTVAVVVDDIVTQNAETGEVNRQAWDDNELQRLAILVRDAVGFDPARGDSVNVINSPFVEVEGDTFEYQEPPIWEQPWFQKYMQWILSGLGVLLVYLIGIRPISKGLVNNAEQAREAEQQRALAAAGVGEMGDEGGEAALGLSGGDSLLLPSPSESYEQQLNAVKGMIAEDPGRVAQVIKQWVNQGE